MNIEELNFFMHELANKFTVLEGNLSMAIRIYKENPLDPAVLTKIEKSQKYLLSSIEMLTEYREKISKEEI